MIVLARHEKRYLKNLVFNFTGLKLMFRKNDCTCLNTWHNNSGKISYQNINVNLDQLDRLHYKSIIKLNFSKDNFIYCLQVILHEIAHYKKIKKFNSNMNLYNNDVKTRSYYYHEKISNRYAKKYYHKILSVINIF